MSTGRPATPHPQDRPPARLWLQLLLSLATASLLVLALRPLGSGAVPLTAAAYTVTEGEQLTAGEGPTEPPAPHLLQPLVGRKSRLSLLFHRSLNVRLRIQLTPPPAGAPPLPVEVRKNDARPEELTLVPGGTVAADLPVVKGDQLTVALAARDPEADTGTLARIALASQVRPTLYIPVVLTWAALLVALQRLRRPLLVVLAITVLSLTTAAETRTFGPLSFPSLAAYSGLVYSSFILAAFFTNQRFLKPLISSLMTSIFSLIFLALPTIYFAYSLSFDQAIDTDILNAIFQTNFAEAIEFLFYQFGFLSLAAVFLMVLAVIVLGYFETRFLRPAPPSPFTAVCCSVLLLLVISNFHDLRILEHFRSAYQNYSSEIAAFERTLETRAAAGLHFRADTKAADQVHILVIGESQNRSNMGLYGYVRPTTPHLSRLAADGDLLVCRNAFSSHTHTTETLSLALTSANQQNKRDFFSSASLVDIARAAGFETCWISNQAMYGPWDNVVSALAANTDVIHRLNTSVGTSTRTRKLDAAVVPILREFVNNGGGNKLAIIHLMGNHGNYCDRYPQEFAVYSRSLRNSVFGGLSGRFDRTLNCYDNSMLYNDAVVQDIIGVLRESGRPAALMYFADHADDVLGGLRHASSQFTYPMTSIPTFFWLSHQYEGAYPEKREQLAEHLDELYPNDFVYDTMVGLMGIATDEYDARWDLSSANYRLGEDEALTLSGRRRFADSRNIEYHQRKNLQLLRASGLATRYVPHRVNTLGKLAQIVWDGAKGAEADVWIDESLGTIRVGHDLESLTDGTLEELLSSPAAGTLEKLWLDLKNLTPRNVDFLQQEILDLDRRHGLKDRTIVETSNPSVDLGALRAAGFHTSYYLPTSDMLTVIERSDAAASVALADTIARRASAGAFAAVSFDARAYPFVSKYLAPRLERAVVFHVWDLGTKMWQPDLLAHLRRSGFFADPRVATVLLPYHSVFSF
ncbi:MAG TPA: sulfatase-like hydrolase/transferase [Thermoanaerobaculales bacterium]|nr:sulfatase-like hydrolase/transferase [Thermoanaerobaculales bacterium]HPA80973.1 sulfatase-like hydrolase/transferase [Thermoanaerobaculales bacterium]HQL29962.1 sulfatase-like hydrolase/transferase [Thermoanaerobaculales bacterium]HQN94919.1 sulfatase-like hydrolase/transferase [Thermoanaerobaculales bacterium]HQP44289.1 sulfatase-like hydrolase/transferase [Thermoanaerobaculales bacterium]